MDRSTRNSNTMTKTRRRMVTIRFHSHWIRMRKEINSTFMGMVTMEKGMMKKAMTSLQ